MKTFKQFIAEVNQYAKRFSGGGYHPVGVMYHGSATGDLRGGLTGLHLGTHEAASQALNARIGHPLHGTWDGTRQYHQTKLAGQATLRKRGPYLNTGYNSKAPEHDYYPHEHPEGLPEASSGVKIEPHHMPRIRAYKIVGPMTNSPHKPHNDWKANGYMKGQKKRGAAKSGYFYKNEAEDAGSISAVVPDASHIREV